MWALNGSAFIISLALARQGRTEEAALLAEGHHERHAWMGTTDAVYRGMALSIACAACGRQGEALAHAHEGRAGRALHRLQPLPVAFALEHLSLCATFDGTDNCDGISGAPL